MKYPAVVFAAMALSVMGFSQTVRPKKPDTSTPETQAAKPKAGATPKKSIKTVDEKVEFDAAWAPADPAARVALLKQFLKDHPNSSRTPVVYELLSRAEFDSANAALQTGDENGAASLFTAAAEDAPSPVPEKLFTEAVSKIAPALFWRGKRIEAFAAAAAIEAKASTAQMLEIAAFYMSVENGAEAKRIALAVIEKIPASAAAYQTLALADRIDFDLEGSAAAYAKAFELDPGSNTARRGLAEMKRALGLSDEAVSIYRELLGTDPSSSPARTGLVLSLFDAGKQADAETELSAALDANPGNVMLLAGAAYWYDAHGNGKKGIELAQRAIASDPRFIWSHIALARGYMAEKQPLDAERTLLAARRYGNFPTLGFEIASARLMAGFYREAAEELAASFSIKDGVVGTKLGGRIPHESSDLADVIALERKASIAAPVSGDSSETSRKLGQLLDLWIKLESNEPNSDAVAKAADAFADGDDRMRIHRELFAAKELLDRKKAVEKAAQLARNAVGNADASLDVPSPEAAVMADALYDNRRLAVIRDEYIRVPEVPRPTLLNIVRGRIEDLNGRALFEAGNVTEAVTRLKRAVSVLPAGSLWWRSTTWRLGTALEADGKTAEALDAYVRSYKSGGPDLIRYSTIATLYRKLNGDVRGLEDKIGPDPAATQSAKSAEALPSPSLEIKDAIPVPAVSPEPPAEVKTQATPESRPETRSELIAQPSPVPTPEVKADAVPDITPASTTAASPTVSPQPPSELKADPIVQPEHAAETKTRASPESTPLRTQDPTPGNLQQPVSEPTPRPTTVAATAVEKKGEDIVAADPQPSPTATPAASSESVSAETTIAASAASASTLEKTGMANPEPAVTIKNPETSKKELFPPVVITIPPPPDTPSKAVSDPSVSTSAGADRSATTTVPTDSLPPVLPCTVTVSEPTLTLQKGAGDLAVIVGTEDDREITEVSARSSEPKDVEVRREPIAGIKARALFVVSSISDRIGVFSVTFKLPCGQKELSVKVR
jgi:tetratricopeptide (TPR) repeat protein